MYIHKPSILQDLLTLILPSLDSHIDIKSFQDEKLQVLLKKMGYPFKLSKTRFMSLGSSHTYMQTLHLLAWLCKQGEIIQMLQFDPAS